MYTGMRMREVLKVLKGTERDINTSFSAAVTDRIFYYTPLRTVFWPSGTAPLSSAVLKSFPTPGRRWPGVQPVS